MRYMLASLASDPRRVAIVERPPVDPKFSAISFLVSAGWSSNQEPEPTEKPILVDFAPLVRAHRINSGVIIHWLKNVAAFGVFDAETMAYVVARAEHVVFSPEMTVQLIDVTIQEHTPLAAAVWFTEARMRRIARDGYPDVVIVERR
jgi:hypothetical protein